MTDTGKPYMNILFNKVNVEKKIFLNSSNDLNKIVILHNKIRFFQLIQYNIDVVTTTTITTTKKKINK